MGLSNILEHNGCCELTITVDALPPPSVFYPLSRQNMVFILCQKDTMPS